MHVVRCGHCGTDIEVNAWREPLSYAEREPNALGERRLVVIGGDGLLHECVIDEEKARRAGLPHAFGHHERHRVPARPGEPARGT